MRTVRKRSKSLDEGGVGRVELLLSESVVDVAVGVEFVTASAKVGRGQGRGDITQEISGKVDDLGERKAELTSRGLVGVGCPGRGVKAGNILGVGGANDGGVPWGINFLRTISATTSSLFHHAYQEDVDPTLPTTREMSKGSREKGGKTYCSSVLNNVLYIAFAVHLVGRVGTVGSKLRVLCNLERETLAVGNMPMERVDLDPTHRVERP